MKFDNFSNLKVDSEKIRKSPLDSVVRTCPHCGKQVILPIIEQDVINWEESGQNIQSYFPQLSPAEREMLITGICGECWNEIFPPEEE